MLVCQSLSSNMVCLSIFNSFFLNSDIDVGWTVSLLYILLIHLQFLSLILLGPILFLLYINDFHHSSKVFDFHLFADDTNLFCKHKNLTSLKASINNELSNNNSWLCANKLSLNIEKNSFVIFHPPQRKVTFNFHLTLNGKQLQQDSCIKYLGILIDTNLSGKPQIACIVKKIKRSVGILSKLHHY